MNENEDGLSDVEQLNLRSYKNPVSGFSFILVAKRKLTSYHSSAEFAIPLTQILIHGLALFFLTQLSGI